MAMIFDNSGIRKSTLFSYFLNLEEYIRVNPRWKRGNSIFLSKVRIVKDKE